MVRVDDVLKTHSPFSKFSNIEQLWNDPCDHLKINTIFILISSHFKARIGILHESQLLIGCDTISV